jgi:hypothetical protein
VKWATRQKVRVNHTVTAWLIRRFIDPGATFLFVEAERVSEVQRREGATGFDAPGATYPHIDDMGRCSFEALVGEYRCGDAALRALAQIVRGADFADQIGLTPESAGLRAISHGFPLVARDDIAGKAVIVNFFASWCPVCSMELKDLRTLQPELRERDVSVIEVLVDPVETPDTVDAARQQLVRNPLPFPVVMMVPALRDVFRYEGFPATYFVTADGTFSTTLFGYQPIEQLRRVASEIASEGTITTAPPSSPVPPGGFGQHPPWEKQPLLALVPAHWAQWHPLLVHFPIALLVLEAVLVSALLVRPNERLAQCSTWLLGAAVVSLIPTILTGIRDAGADLGPGSPFWNGVHDRLTNLLRLEVPSRFTSCSGLP